MSKEHQNARKAFDALEKRAPELKKELRKLNAAKQQADEQLAAYDREADAIFAAAERDGDAKAKKDSVKAEQRLAELAMTCKKKNAAVNACNADIETNTQALKEAKQAVDAAQLADVLAEAHEIAAAIQLDPRPFLRLMEIWTDAIRLQNAQPSDSLLGGKRSAPFTDPRVAFARYMFGFADSLWPGSSATVTVPIGAKKPTMREALFE